MKKPNGRTHDQVGAFNSFVRQAERRSRIYEDNFSTRYELNTLLSFMPNLEKASVIDIGSGIGRFAIPIAKVARRVFAIDTSDESINILRKQAKHDRVTHLDAKVMDYNELPASTKYDYVLLVNVVHHVPDASSLFATVRKILKKEGMVVIFENNPLNPLFLIFFAMGKQLSMHLNRAYMRSNIWSLRKILGNSQFSEVAMHRYAFLPTSLYNISPLFVKVNATLNSIPIINTFCAFHIITCKIRRYE